MNTQDEPCGAPTTAESMQRIESVSSAASNEPAPQPYELTPHQRIAYDEIVAWIASFNLGAASSARILAGYAGTGKTFLVKALVKSMRSSTVLCAPTNQAVKELQKLGTGLTCCTIYSLLGLKMEQHEDKLRLVKAIGSKIHRYQYVILDECSMVSPELYVYIEQAMKNGVRFLFVGDPKQLPPIGYYTSPVWKKFETSALTEVIRNANQILEFATRVRRSKLSDLVIASNNTKTEGVWHLNSFKFEDRVRKHAKAGLFTTSETKILCWRNNTVADYNHIVRHVLYGDKVFTSQYLVGDHIVFTSPHTISEGFEVFTDDQAVVTEVTVGKHTDYDFKCYYLTVDLYSRIGIVKVIHEDDQKLFDRLLTDYASAARRGDRSMWGKFWMMKESVASVKYAHALTVHRAQGSTYTNVFVDVGDILANPNKPEARKCLYVAATRPTTKLYLT